MRFSEFASVKVSVAIMAAIAVAVLLGAWCPQESQLGYQKVVETFGADTAAKFRQIGLTDIFHTPLFLFLIALLSLNMVVVSCQRVFPKVKNLRHKMPFLSGNEITKMPTSHEVSLPASSSTVLDFISAKLRLSGYSVTRKDGKLTAESGKFALLAATITHIGLLSLLTGVTITSWTGFSGFQPVYLGGTMTFGGSEHSKLWIGKLPDWKVKVEDTRRENYESGDPKQWYSKLSVLDAKGKLIKQQEISVNNPLSYDGVDIYQSSWALDSILIAFNDRLLKLPLEQMGKTHAAFVPLDKKTILIFSLPGTDKPLRIFAKIPEWQSPKKLAEVPVGKAAKFGAISIGYVKALPVTGLQYKCDPGLPITYTAFGFIMVGVLLAAIPHRQLWVSVTEENGVSTLATGGISRKAKSAFAKSLSKLCSQLKENFGEAKSVSQTTGDTLKESTLTI